MELLPLYDASAPVTCTIAGAEVEGRVALLELMRTEVQRIDRSPHGLLLHFISSADLEAALCRFAAEEKTCCRFWGFAVLTEPSLRLRWDGPPSASELLDAIEAYLRGAAPLSTIAQLL
jgi:hypothetical protein